MKKNPVDESVDKIIRKYTNNLEIPPLTAEENEDIINNIFNKIKHSRVPEAVIKEMQTMNYWPTCINGHTLSKADKDRRVSRCPDCGAEIEY